MPAQSAADRGQPITRNLLMQAASSNKAAGKLQAVLNTLFDARGIPQGAVDAVAVANIAALTGAASAVDGVNLTATKVVLCTAQTDASENGPWVAAAGAWARPAGFTGTVAGFQYVASGGTVYGGSVWLCDTADGSAEADTNDLNFVLVELPANYTGGDGIVKAGNDFAVDPDNTTIEISGGKVAIKALGVDTAQIALLAVETAQLRDDAVDKDKIDPDIAGLGLAQAAGGELDVTVDTTTIEINADTLRVKAGGITANELGTDAVETVKIKNLNVTTSKIADDAVDKDKIAADVAGLGLVQNVDGSLEIAPDGVMLELVGDTIAIKALGVDTAQIAADAIDGTKIADNAVAKEHIAPDVAGVGIDQAGDGSLELSVPGAGLDGGGGAAIKRKRFAEGAIQTGDATPTNVTGAEITTADDTVYLVEAKFLGRHVTVAGVSSFMYVATFTRGTGVGSLAIDGTAMEMLASKAQGAEAAGIYVDVATGKLHGRVTGYAAEDTEWTCELNWLAIATA